MCQFSLQSASKRGGWKGLRLMMIHAIDIGASTGFISAMIKAKIGRKSVFSLRQRVVQEGNLKKVIGLDLFNRCSKL